MKIFSVARLLVISFVLIAASLEAQTTSMRYKPPLPSKMTQASGSRVMAVPITDFKLLSSGTGWAIGGAGLLWTTDNGEHWKNITPELPGGITDVDFLDAQRGWILYSVNLTNEENPDHAPNNFSHLYLASTIDGGASWTTVSQLPKPDYSNYVTGTGGVVFFDDMHGWVEMGVDDKYAILYSTSDGGKTWRLRKGGGGDSFAIVPTSAKDLWLVGDPYGELFVSHDAGNTVQQVSLPNPPSVSPDYSASYSPPVFKTNSRGYEVVNYRGPDGTQSMAALFSTMDGGRTWQPDRILSGLAEGETANSSIADSTWILPFLHDEGGPAELMKVLPGERVTAPAHSKSDFNRCQSSFITADEGWVRCPGAYGTSTFTATTDGGATSKTIVPRVRNGVLTDDPIKPVQ